MRQLIMLCLLGSGYFDGARPNHCLPAKPEHNLRSGIKIWVKKYEYEPEMVWVDGGTFTMGCTDEQESYCYKSEKPAHQVTLKGFYTGKFEVTQAQWKAVMGANPSSFPDCEDCPVENVSSADAQDYLGKLNQKTGRNYRLLTESEWEFAARGGTKTQGYMYPGGDNLNELGWFAENSDSKPHPVGRKAANELGLYDMAGNVWERCSDWYGDYTSAAENNPNGASAGAGHVIRGGYWLGPARICRVSNRGFCSLGYRNCYLGFRVALSQ